MKIQYIDKKFTRSSLDLIEKANDIIEEYAAQGFSLTLRQLYYQFVARDFISNALKEYKKLGSVISNARLAGLIDWQAIEDRTRFVRELAHWSSPADILQEDADNFRVNKWLNQQHRPEVWIEKDALVGVITGVCENNDVPFFACRGYVSQSEIWRAARRFAQYYREGYQPLVIYLGDHDPSGIDMTRDIEARLSELGAPETEVKRIALNIDQVETFNPPPNPAKMTDTRAADYINRFGNDSWELDALDPVYIAQIIQEVIDEIKDAEQWQDDLDYEEAAKERLQELADNWQD